MSKKNRNLKDNIPEIAQETEINPEISNNEAEEIIQALDGDNIPEIAQETEIKKIVFKYYDEATFKSSISLNGYLSNIECVKGIIKTDDENLANFLMAQPHYTKMEDK